MAACLPRLIVLRQAIGQASDGRDIELGAVLGLARVEEVHAGVRAN